MICLFCNEELDENSISDHVLEQHNRQFCVSCEGYFADANRYNAHQCVEDDEESENDSQEAGISDRHEISTDLNSLPVLIPEIDDVEKLVGLAENCAKSASVCFCGEIFDHRGTLSKHHTNSECKLRNCRECGRDVASVSSLLTHRCAKSVKRNLKVKRKRM